MAEAKLAATRRIGAPYIPDVMLLLNHGHDAVCTIFYRTSDPSFTTPPKDILAIGQFKEHSCSWAEFSAEPTFAPALNKLIQVLQSPVTLAGYVSYELGYAFENRWHCLDVPHNGYAWRFLEVDCWYETDHSTKTATILANEDIPENRVHLLQQVIEKGSGNQNIYSRSAPGLERLPLDRVAKAGELNRDEYKLQVDKILEDINNGRYYELNFTQRFSVDSAKHPVAAFQKLFNNYRPQRGFYCDFGSEVIGSCSPELFLKKEDTAVFTRPIKGSFNTNTSDRDLDKLHAEHVMVVDLARNDIGRISDLERVHVPEFVSTSSFGGLKHMESLVCGYTSLQLDQILPLTYPAASITGAPKVEVVRAISEYEKSCRGLYTGACGWKWGSGDFDLNVAIRTFDAVKRSGGWNYTVGAGGAIVADSVPDQEYEECLQKAQPLISELIRNE